MNIMSSPLRNNLEEDSNSIVMLSPEKMLPEKDGLISLKRYQKAKAMSPMRKSSSSLLTSDGSLVGLAYKESKSRDLSLSLLEKGPDEDITPLKDRTNSIRNDRSVLKVYMNNQLDLQSSELQYYEEQLFEIAERLEIVTTERDLLQLEKQKLESKQQIGHLKNDGEFRKVYMDNQLDLQNTEMQYYEEQLDQIATQLETVIKERDEIIIERDNLKQLIQAKESISELPGDQLKQYQLDLEEKDNIIDELKSNVTAVEKELEQCNMMFEGLNDQLDRKDATIEELKGKNNSLSLQNDEINTIVVTLNNEKEKLLMEMNNVNTLLASKDSELSLMESSLNEFQHQFNTVKPLVEERNKTIQELKLQCKQYREQLSKLETELSAEKEGIQMSDNSKLLEYETQLQEKADVVAQLEQNVISWQMAYKQYEESNAALENYKLELESTVMDLRNRLDSSSSQLGDYSEKVASLENELKIIIEQNNDYAQSLAESRFALAASEDTASFLQSRLDDIDRNGADNIQTIIEEKQRIVEEKRSIEIRLQEVFESLNEKDQAIAQLKEQYSKKEAELLRVRDDSEYLQDALIKKQEKEDSAEELLINLRGERDDAMTAIKELHDEISKRDGAIEIYMSELERLQALYTDATEKNNNFSDSDIKNELFAKVEALEKSVVSLQNQLKDVSLEKDDLSLKLKLVTHSRDDLQQSLMSNQEIINQSMASSQLDISQMARSERMLEDDNLKLRGIVDHLRIVNNKLMEDIKIAQEECMKFVGLESRLKSSEQNEQSLEEKLVKAEAALMKKEIEILEAVGKAQVADDKLLMEKEVEISTLTENLKETEEKWQTALREIDAFQQSQLESTNSQIDELQNLFHKISIYEKQIGDQCHLLEVNDRAIKSLQSDLFEKEKRLEVLETQKIEMTVNTLVTDSNIVSDDVSNVVEMERTISTLKEQIAVLEASNIAREDALATAMTKYAEFLDEARVLHIECEKYKEECQSRSQENELLQLRLSEAQKDLSLLRDEFSQLRNITHRNTLQEVANAEDTIRELKDELEATKGDLKNANSSVTSMKEVSKSLESRLESLQSELAGIFDQETISKQYIQNKTHENEQLRLQLDETVEKLSTMRSQLISSEEQSIKMRKLEEQVASLSEQLSYVELMEIEIASDMKEFALLNDVDKVNDLFASPLPSNTKNNDRPLLQGILCSIKELKIQYNEIFHSNKSLDNEIHRMIEDQKRSELLEQNMHMMMYERDLIATQTVIEAVEIVIRQSQSHVIDLEHKMSKSVSRINAAIDSTNAKAIHRNAIALPEVTDGIDAVSNILNLAFSNLGDYLASVCNVIETLSSENMAISKNYEKLENQSLEKIQSLKTERLTLQEQLSILQKTYKNTERERLSITNVVTDTKSELQKKEEEIIVLRNKLNEYTSSTNELESEFRKSTANIEDLRSALKEAEALCIHLRGKIRLLQGELELKDKDIISLSNDVESYRKKLITAELNYEKADASTERLKAEVYTLENTRHHLESELERSRIELLGLKVTPNFHIEEGFQFEIEKLMASLRLTLDHMSSLSSKRVSLMNNRLSEFRNWSRNEFRSHRQLEVKVQSLEEDLQREHRLQDEMNRLLTIAEQTKSEREALLMRNEYVIADLQAAINKYQENQNAINDNDEKLQLLLEDEQRRNQKLSLELKIKDSELASLTKGLENAKSECNKLQEKNDTINQKLLTFSHCDVSKEEETRQIKASVASLNAKIEHLQRELEFSERARNISEKKAIDFEITSSSSNRLKEQLKESERNLTTYKNDLKTAIHDKESAELSSDFKSRELDSAKQRINNLESRLTANQKEKEQMADEISDLRHALLKAKEKAEYEASKRMHLEKSLESTRQLDASESDTLKSRLQQVQNEMISLKNTVNHLNKDNKEKENQYINETNKRIKLEDDVIKMKKSLDNLSREHSKMSDRFSINRVEKGQLEEHLRSITSRINELIMLAKLYSNSAGININFKSIEATISADSHVNEIINAVDNMCVVFDCLMKKLKTSHYEKDSATLAYSSDEKLRKLKEDLMLVQSHSDRNNEIQNRLLKANSAIVEKVEKRATIDQQLEIVETKQQTKEKKDKSNVVTLQVVGGDSKGSASLRSIKVAKSSVK